MHPRTRSQIAQSLRAAAQVLAADTTDTSAALSKVRETLKRLGLATNALTEAVKFSDEATIKPALTSMAKLQKLFEKQEAALSKVIRDAASTAAPPELKTEAKKIEKLLKARLLDPAELQVIPWQNTSTFAKTPGTDFQFVFRLPKVLSHGRMEKYDAILSVNVGGQDFLKPGVLQQQTSVLRMNADYKSAKDFVNLVVEQLKDWGWTGIVGEAEANTGRAQVAADVAKAINGVTQRLESHDREDATTKLPRVEGAYRSNLPKEGERAVGEYEYGDMVKREIASCRKLLDPALAPFKDKIKSVDVHDGEKSWIYITVTLK